MGETIGYTPCQQIRNSINVFAVTSFAREGTISSQDKGDLELAECTGRFPFTSTCFCLQNNQSRASVLLFVFFDSKWTDFSV